MRRLLAGLLGAAALAFVSWPQDRVVQSLEHQGVSRLVLVQGGLFEVTVKGWSGSSVRVELLSADPQERVSDRRDGGDLLLEPVQRQRVRSIGSRAPQISIRVPESTALSLETGTGSILVETVSGSKAIRTTTGAITVRSSRGDVEARSSTGSQRYDYVTGDVRAESTTGAIELANTQGRADLKSTTGGLWGRSVRLTADSTFRTSAGRIEMDFANPLEEITFSLRSATGSIEVGGTRARGTVETGNGALRVTGQTTTGRQTYR